ncbi:MAG TPA: protoporphyrinogen oxidase [Pyrinomonadaceae bacterium]|nr:protoporphyrinogen oxidase [Pyrinomonadaceae bacterium]
MDTKRKLRRVLIIGGGISGLAAAHRILEQNSPKNLSIEVLLIEASSRLGGIIRTERRDGFLLEAGPDAFLSEKPEAVELAQRLGIADHLIETNRENRRSFIVRDGRLHPVPEGFQLLAPSRFRPFLTSGIFSIKGKARMALDLVLPRRRETNGAGDESLAQFVRRRLGQEALERMAQPMVGGIYTADPELLSLRATMPRFLKMEREHRSLILAMWRARKTAEAERSQKSGGARYNLFLSFDEGMQTLVDAIAGKLPPASIRLNTKADSLSFDEGNGKWLVQTSKGERIGTDALCLALPSYSAAALLKETDAALARELEGIAYASSATINLAFRREDVPHPLDGFGFVVPFVEKRSIIACSFSSVKFAGRSPDGFVLLRAFLGGALQPEIFALDEDEMLAATRRDLKLLGIERAPTLSMVQKWPRSMAQYHVGHIEKVERINKRLEKFPTLKLAGNAYSGAGIPDCIRSGWSAAEEILNAEKADAGC